MQRPDHPAQAKATADALRRLFGEDLLAVYLHGSAVSGGLRPQSDIDLIAVIAWPMTEDTRRHLLSFLLRTSGRHPAQPDGPRCIELMVFLVSDLAEVEGAARAEFVYGEWLRDACEAGAHPVPGADPEYTLLLAQARNEACPLLGPAATTLLPAIPMIHVRRAMAEALPSLVEGLPGDERNVLLTLARMWYTAATGAFVPKDIAAAWAMPRLPEGEAAVLAYARRGYLGEVADDWEDRQSDAARAVAYLQERVSALL